MLVKVAIRANVVGVDKLANVGGGCARELADRPVIFAVVPSNVAITF